MELIKDRLYIDLGDCRGRAMCGTCQVELEVDNNEQQTLKNQTNMAETSRLACHILVDEHLHGQVFKVLKD